MGFVLSFIIECLVLKQVDLHMDEELSLFSAYDRVVCLQR